MLPTLRDPGLFPAWFKRILASQCGRLRRRKKTTELHDGETPDPSSSEFEEMLSKREIRRLVQDALQALPPSQRLVVALFYFAGQDQAAIAKFLGVPSSTVAKRLFAARRTLAPLLHPLEVDLTMHRPSRTARFVALVRSGIYDGYIGRYRFVGRPELTVEVKRTGNRLTTLTNGQRNTVLLGARLAELRVAEFDGRAQFFRDRSGEITHFVYYEFGKRMGAAKKLADGGKLGLSKKKPAG